MSVQNKNGLILEQNLSEVTGGGKLTTVLGYVATAIIPCVIVLTILYKNKRIVTRDEDNNGLIDSDGQHFIRGARGTDSRRSRKSGYW